MSTEDLLELRSYQTQGRMTSTAPVATKMTFYDLLVQAAQAEYGQNITILHTVLTDNQLKNFRKSVSIKVLHREEKPTPVGRTIVDISTKEFKNYATEDGNDPTAKDITKATVSKSSASSIGQSYQFISTQGLAWEASAIGLQILAMGMAGGAIGFGQDSSVVETFGNSLQSSLGFEFSQEEAVCVPPGKKVHVTITTSKVLYQLGYTLEFSVPKNWSVFVSYSKPCLCGLFKCSSSRYIPYSRIVRNLPNYREDDLFAYFTQEGFLSWMGESCEVDKKEALV